MERPLCPHCLSKLVMPSGHPKAPYLFVGEFPGREEINKGIPFIGEAGLILLKEMQRVGIDQRQCRFTNLWLHAPSKDQRCIDFCYDALEKEMEGRKGLIFMGSELSKLYLNDSVIDWAGLDITRHSLIEIPDFTGWMMIMPNPALAMHQAHGEIRLSLEKIKRRMKSDGQAV